MKQIHLSVRQLVEFLLQSGSIDSRFSGFDRAAEGARIHRKLQKAEGEGYDAEVYLKQEYTAAGVCYLIDGRADGIFTQDGLVTVDEIKTVTIPTPQITQDMKPVHWAQGQVYAAIYAAQHELREIAVRLTYYQVDEEQTIRFVKRFTSGELETFVAGLLNEYAPWAKRAAAWGEGRAESLKALEFPFAGYRAGQRGMAAAAYRAFRDKERLLCQAPTGIGKTMSALFPALKAMSEGCGERIFYLTARTTARAAAESALAALRQSQPGLCLKSITLTAKDKACLLEKRECTPDACPYANGYYDRVKDALWNALEQNEFTRPELDTLAERYTVCPFELGLDLSLWCDVIVGDYNYLFDPVVSLKRFFETVGDYLFLVDEAHNLPDRARDMHSASLLKSQLYEARKLLPKGKGKLKTALGKTNTALIELRRRCEEQPSRTFFEAEPLKELNRLLSRVTGPLEEWLEEHREGETHEILLTLYFDLREYLRVAEGYDEHYVTQISAFGGEVRVSQLCLDPSAFVNASLNTGRAAVLFSATLSPTGYYKDLLGCPEAKCAVLPSPFDSVRLGLYCAGDVSTRYKDREQSLDCIARYLYAMTQGKPGNYLTFFPSYAYLKQVYERFTALYPTLPTLLQESGMDEEQRKAFLDRFESGPSETLLGFGVLGGVFGEGVDLTGDRLIGTAIVGVGLPQVNPRQEILRQYFEATRGSGFDYAYRYPGFNKVMQAAGRVIRTPEDKGVVLLIDDRFAASAYRRLFPPHWSHCRFVYGHEQLEQQLAAFWTPEQ